MNALLVRQSGPRIVRCSSLASSFIAVCNIMGNSSSSSTRAHQEDTVDFGSLVPQGVYTGPRDWNQPIVSQHIVARKLAPFYRPLEEYDPSWDDDQILAARKELPESDNADTVTRIEAAATAHLNASKSANKRPGVTKESGRPEAAVYRGAVECPICFLVSTNPLSILPILILCWILC